jgi:hypothetical protein
MNRGRRTTPECVANHRHARMARPVNNLFMAMDALPTAAELEEILAR